MAALDDNPQRDTEPTTAHVVAADTTSRRARVARAVDMCLATKTRGDVITRRELEAWLAVAYPTSGSRRDFERAALLFAALKADFDEVLLHEHRMAVESERGGRWRIVSPEEQAELAMRLARDGFRRTLAKSVSVATHVDVAALNDTQRAALDATTARLAAIQMFARKNLPRLGGGER